jgi:hypothetical protein
MANFVTDVFGDTPDVARYIKTIFGDEQLKAIEENMAAMPKITELGGQYYDYMSGLLNKAIPGYSGILAKGGDLAMKMQGIADQELSGLLPEDVSKEVFRSSAFQNLLSGAGGGMASSNAARNLGLTSLDMIGRGEKMQASAGNAAQQWSNLANQMIMNPASFFITPQQQAALTMQNNLYKQATQQLRYNLAAAPDPVAAGVSNTIMNVIGAYIGKGGLGAGGGAGATPGGGSDAAAGATQSQFGGALGTLSNWLGGGGTFAKSQGGSGGLAAMFGSGGAGGVGGGNAGAYTGGPGGGAGTSALGLAGSTAFGAGTGLNKGVPNTFGTGPGFGDISLRNPMQGYNTNLLGQEQPIDLAQLLGAGSLAYNSNLGGLNMYNNSLGNIWGPSPTGTSDFLGQNTTATTPVFNVNDKPAWWDSIFGGN